MDTTIEGSAVLESTERKVIAVGTDGKPVIATTENTYRLDPPMKGYDTVVVLVRDGIMGFRSASESRIWGVDGEGHKSDWSVVANHSTYDGNYPTPDTVLARAGYPDRPGGIPFRKGGEKSTDRLSQ